MRWLLPYVLALALAAGEPVASAVSDRRRRGAARARDAGRAPEVDPGAAFAAQGGTFDPSTGTLTWFDDDFRYN